MISMIFMNFRAYIRRCHFIAKAEINKKREMELGVAWLHFIKSMVMPWKKLHLRATKEHHKLCYVIGPLFGMFLILLNLT